MVTGQRTLVRILPLSAFAQNIDQTDGNNCCGNPQPDFGVMLFEDDRGTIAEIHGQPAQKPESDKAAEGQR